MATTLREFTDVRELQRQLKDRGVNMISEADESSTGPTSFMIVDPDGNTILVDPTRIDNVAVGVSVCEATHNALQRTRLTARR
jgi:hypothetical protein